MVILRFKLVGAAAVGAGRLELGVEHSPAEQRLGDRMGLQSLRVLLRVMSYPSLVLVISRIIFLRQARRLPGTTEKGCSGPILAIYCYAVVRRILLAVICTALMMTLVIWHNLHDAYP